MAMEFLLRSAILRGRMSVPSWKCHLRPPELLPGPAALGFVCAGSPAEQIWAWSVNDPNLPPKDRQDLIEDLNEEGFPDPKNITVDDLPLILSRLELIEAFAPDSMDEVNAAA